MDVIEKIKKLQSQFAKERDLRIEILQKNLPSGLLKKKLEIE